MPCNGTDDVGVTRTRAGTESPRRREHRPRVVGLLPQHGDVLGVERHPELADELRERVADADEGPAQRGQGLGLGARPRRVGRAA